MRNKLVPAFWSQKVIRPLLSFITQGLSAQKLALTLAVGIILGTFAVFGVTTILCTLAAFILKLSLPAIQFANYLVYTLQIILLVPYYQLGDLLFSAQQSINLNAFSDMPSGGNPKEILTIMLESTLYAVGAWLLLSPVILALLYTGVKPVVLWLKSSTPKFKSFPR
jgi:hypothetical protein